MPSPATPAGGFTDDDAPRGSLRLRMGRALGADRLDGAWWPRSRDISIELAGLVDHLPAGCGPVVRALVSSPDWDSPPESIPTSHGRVEVGRLPGDDIHLIELVTAERTVLHLLVVPPELSDDQGAEAMLAGATAGNSHSAGDLLAVVTEHPDVDPADHWQDGGGSWWEGRTAPSFRP